ncbi:methylmalonyl-CoA epimerase [Bacteroides fragilis]|nr:methylmalonyl-CoA epimerase [Bacteroides fragilis]KXU48222.1 methylmalonyl-CoA epimerase [Bacteroides fragilis]
MQKNFFIKQELIFFVLFYTIPKRRLIPKFKNIVMKISHIEHLGIAVKSIEEALPYYENVLGLKCYNIETVEDQKVRTAFLKVGDTKIELLEPTCPESTIAKFIENKGAGVHHVAFAIEDGVANALAEAESKEIRLIDKAPRKGAEGLNIAFLHPKSTLGVLTELCEH